MTEPHAVMFHHFHGPTHPAGQGSISSADFENLIAFLKSNFTLLNAGQWYSRFINNQLRDGEICLSFDDALLCQYEIALPVMERHSLQAFWFVYSSVFRGEISRLEIYRFLRSTCFTDFEDFFSFFMDALKRSPYRSLATEALESFDPDHYLSQFPFYSKNDRIFRYVRDRVLGAKKYDEVMDQIMNELNFSLNIEKLWMTEEHLRRLESAGHIIGLHSYSHPTVLADLPAEQQLREYKDNLEHLSSILSRQIRCMSHPCNSFNQDTLRILEHLGIHLGFCANLTPPFRSPLTMPREDHANLMRHIVNISPA